MKIFNLKLKNLVGDKYIIEQEFEYAGTKGVAQILGWQIVFFAKKSNPDKVAVISFYEIEDEELFKISNSILDLINIKVKFGDRYKNIYNQYGEANFIDNIYDNMDRYNYVVSDTLFISFGLKNNIVVSIEIVNDKEIIENIIETRKIF